MEKYEALEMEIIEFEQEDVIATSGKDGGHDGQNDSKTDYIKLW